MESMKVSFDSKTFWRNTVQVLLLGYFVCVVFAIIISNDFEMVIANLTDPILWLFPFLIAPVIGFVRASKNSGE
ncbi:Ribosomal RNA small subunit methyltransferase F-16S rRNA m5C1407 methyltransferase-rRNA (cytosine-C(5)-)-methyltransferase rsmF [Moritella viscosa]|uniref:Ribosomal RNA small subunit methyltransferase F-16S rRNA m5C1407 methyltransferase-rRNA (Cytosine-C(5)-)-methyltransferase rsmF n=2 Tax=Moritella viscosa TaxID=80854 RepID=A0ABY1HIA7_9GAMM|nr:Ribosomal RNA small subunit methyltransferase F-16S rRNA m5C1407 methyltransferase-rRNA (cytosine-C(5)-)-methyltransferase rsmF [Moritella viscosa]